MQRCPLVIVVENNGYAYSTPTRMQTAAERLADKAAGYGMPGIRTDGNDVLEVLRVTREAVARARAGEGPTLLEMMTYRRKGHAEHDNQRYIPEGEIERWAETNDPIDRFVERLVREFGISSHDLLAIDSEVQGEVDAATDEAEASPPCEGPDALTGVYADPAAAPVLWYRGDSARAVEEHERPASWGTHDG